MLTRWQLFMGELLFEILFPVYNLYFWINIDEFTPSFTAHSIVGIVFTIIISVCLIVIFILNQITNYDAKYNKLVHIKYGLFLLGIINISMFIIVMKKVESVILFGLAGIFIHCIIIILAKMDDIYRRQIKQRVSYTPKEENYNKNEKVNNDGLPDEEQTEGIIKKDEHVESSISTITN